MELDVAIDIIRSRLLDYMDAKGIKRYGSAFSCPNKAAHQNNDAHKSAGIFEMGGTTLWKCQACGAGSDTIAMATIIDHLPAQGPEFIKVTIPAILETLGIDEKIEIEEKPVAALYERIAAQINAPNEFRGISKETLQEFNVGELSYESAHKLARGKPGIKESGFGNNMDLIHDYTMKKVFTNRIVLPIRDRYGQIVAWAGRRKNDDDNSVKWMNSVNTGLFKKSEILYGLDKTRRYIQEQAIVYIVEGYTDVLQMWDKGIKNVVGIMFNSIKKEQAEILDSLKVGTVIISLDTDPETSKTSDKALQSGILLYNHGFSVFIKKIPEIGHDPDSYIRQYGIEKYKEIPEVPLVEYAMYEMIKDTEDSRAIDEYLTWLINNNISKIVITHVIRKLAAYVNLSEDVLFDEYDKLEIEINEDRDLSIKDKINQLSNDLPYLPTRIAVQRIYEAYNDVSVKLLGQMASTDKQIDDINVMQDRQDNPQGLISTGLPTFDEMVKLGRHNGTFVVIAGYPNAGKSQMLRQLVYNMLHVNDNISILYYTIDDSKEDVITALVGHKSQVALTKIRYPDPDDPELALTSQEKERLDKAYNWLKSETANNRIVVAGIDNISTIYVLESVIRNLKRKTNNHIVLCIDSLHSMVTTSLSNINDMRVSSINVSQMLENITNKYGLTTISTAEMIKQSRLVGRKASLADVSETGKIEYLAKVGIIVHNDLLINPKTHLYWIKPSGYLSSMPLPVLEIEIAKNKTNYHKGGILMKMDPAIGKITELSPTEIEQLEANKNKEKKNKVSVTDMSGLFD